MENFKKFSGKALSNDDLSKIKGGAMTDDCYRAYQGCSYDKEICFEGSPSDGWYDCVYAANMYCSPLKGWEDWCDTRWKDQ